MRGSHLPTHESLMMWSSDVTWQNKNVSLFWQGLWVSNLQSSNLAWRVFIYQITCLTWKKKKKVISLLHKNWNLVQWWLRLRGYHLPRHMSLSCDRVRSRDKIKTNFHIHKSYKHQFWQPGDLGCRLFTYQVTRPFWSCGHVMPSVISPILYKTRNIKLGNMLI